MLGNFLWKGNIFRVPMNILCKTTKEGGLGLINVQVKSEALFMKQILHNLKNAQLLHTIG